jgi:rRNA maturation RNase YbeY
MREKRPRTKVAVEASLPRFRGAVYTVRHVVAAALPHLSKRPVSVNVFLISDREMRAVNRTTRRKDCATNVLSFPESGTVPHPELPKGVVAKGEVYLAPDYIARKGERLEPLVRHGLLHLFGYTHRRVRDRMKMERKERELSRLSQR